jgi:hypothetical protein
MFSLNRISLRPEAFQRVEKVGMAVLAVSSLALAVIGALAGLHQLPFHGGMAHLLQHHTIGILSASVGCGVSAQFLYAHQRYQEWKSGSGALDDEKEVVKKRFLKHLAATVGVGVVLALTVSLGSIFYFHQNVEMFSLLGAASFTVSLNGKGIYQNIEQRKKTRVVEHLYFDTRTGHKFNSRSLSTFPTKL